MLSEINAYICYACDSIFDGFSLSCPYCGSSEVYHNGHHVREELSAYNEWIDDMIDEMRDDAYNV